MARRVFSVVASVLASAATCAAAVQPLSSAFTYQGELKSGGSPASGPYDMRMRLFDSVVGGNQVGPTVCADNVGVAEGRYTVALDFGAVMTGQQLFLEISVRPDSGLTCASAAGFTPLAPRQALTAAPYAAYALTSNYATSSGTSTNASQLNGQPPSFYTSATNLSSGTLPSARLSGAYANPLTLSNPANVFAGTGSGLTGLSASNVATGTLADARLSENVAMRGSANTFNAANVFLSDVSVGGGTATHRLTVDGPASTMRLIGPGGFGSGATLNFGDASYVMIREDVDDSLLLQAAGRTAIAGGSLGVGTLAPAARLHVGANQGVAFKVESTNTDEAHPTALISGSTTTNAVLTLSHATLSNSVDMLTMVGTTFTPTLYAGMYANLTGVFDPWYRPAGVVGEVNAGTWDYAYGVIGYVRPTSINPSSATIGVYGRNHNSQALSCAVYSDGRFVSTGTKSFLVDHPLDPLNRALLHYCTEGAEPLNVYRGRATLDQAGEAVVDLPPYFESLNRDPTYQLTPVGGPAPGLHVAEEVRTNRFRIAGGPPGMVVCWRVEAARNDPFVRSRGAPVELEKPAGMKGRLLFDPGGSTQGW